MSDALVANSASPSANSATIHALLSAAAHVERALARVLEPLGLTAAQYSVLQVMHEVDGQVLGCSEIGKRLAAAAPDVTRLLDRLETVGLVARERDKKDRRVVHTRITGAGVTLLSLAVPLVREAEDQVLADLASRDRLHLAALLNDVQRVRSRN